MKSASNSLEKKSSLLIKNMDLSNRLSINSNKRPKHHRRNSDMYQQYVSWKKKQKKTIESIHHTQCLLKRVIKKSLKGPFEKIKDRTSKGIEQKEDQQHNLNITFGNIKNVKKYEVIILLEKIFQTKESNFRRSGFRKLKKNSYAFKKLNNLKNIMGKYGYRKGWKEIELCQIDNKQFSITVQQTNFEDYLNNFVQNTNKRKDSYDLETSNLRNEIREVEQTMKKYKLSCAQKKQEIYDKMNTKNKYKGREQQASEIMGNGKGLNLTILIEQYMEKYQILQTKADDIRQQCEYMVKTKIPSRLEKDVLTEIINLLIPPQLKL